MPSDCRSDIAWLTLEGAIGKLLRAIGARDPSLAMRANTEINRLVSYLNERYPEPCLKQ